MASKVSVTKSHCWGWKSSGLVRRRTSRSLAAWRRDCEVYVLLLPLLDGVVSSLSLPSKKELNAACSSALRMGQKLAIWPAEDFRTKERMAMKISERVTELGEEMEDALSNSSILACSMARWGTIVSLSTARRTQVIRRRLSWVFLSASSRAAAAPTPNMIPAAVGAVRRDSSSGSRPFSANAS